MLKGHPRHLQGDGSADSSSGEERRTLLLSGTLKVDSDSYASSSPRLPAEDSNSDKLEIQCQGGVRMVLPRQDLTGFRAYISFAMSSPSS